MNCGRNMRITTANHVNFAAGKMKRALVRLGITNIENHIRPSPSQISSSRGNHSLEFIAISRPLSKFHGYISIS